MFIHNKDTRSGFTLVELLVSMSVFGVLAVMVLANFHFGTQQDALRTSAQTLVANFRRVQNVAAAGMLVPSPNYAGAPWPPGTPVVPPGGYGIFFPRFAGPLATKYNLFGEFGTYQGGNPACRQVYDGYLDTRCDVLVEGGTYSFQPGVSISYAVFCGFSQSGIALSVLYTPPRPLPYVREHDGFGYVLHEGNFSMELELTHSATGAKRTVIIDAVSGVVSERPGPYEPVATFCS